MKRRIVFAAITVAGMGLLSPLPALATPTIYTFVQQSSSVPGFDVYATITIDGGFADLPYLNSYQPGPDNFGALWDLSISLGGRSFSLGEFTPAYPPGVDAIPGFPLWSISPSEIQFIDPTDSIEFELDFEPGNYEAFFNSDGPSTPSNCEETGACYANGVWEPPQPSPVPEPITLSLFGTGLAGAVAIRRRKK